MLSEYHAEPLHRCFLPAYRRSITAQSKPFMSFFEKNEESAREPFKRRGVEEQSRGQVPLTPGHEAPERLLPIAAEAPPHMRKTRKLSPVFRFSRIHAAACFFTGQQEKFTAIPFL